MRSKGSIVDIFSRFRWSISLDYEEIVDVVFRQGLEIFRVRRFVGLGPVEFLVVIFEQ